MDYSKYMREVNKSRAKVTCEPCQTSFLPSDYRMHVYKVHRFDKKITCVWCGEKVLTGAAMSNIRRDVSKTGSGRRPGDRSRWWSDDHNNINNSSRPPPPPPSSPVIEQPPSVAPPVHEEEQQLDAEMLIKEEELPETEPEEEEESPTIRCPPLPPLPVVVAAAAVKPPPQQHLITKNPDANATVQEILNLKWRVIVYEEKIKSQRIEMNKFKRHHEEIVSQLRENISLLKKIKTIQ